MNTSNTISLERARRLALRSQGFANAPAAKLAETGSASASNAAQAKPRALRQCIDTMAALQIDAINTVIRSHYMPLFSRLGHYRRSDLDAQVFAQRSSVRQPRRYFEYWGHECSLLPMALQPLLRWRMEDAANGVGIYKQLSQLARQQPQYVREVRAEIADRGALTCRELDGGARGKGMWEWSVGKQALEYLFASGECSCAGRQSFQRRYDLTERVMPGEILDQPSPPRIEAQATLLEIAAGALGIGTESDLRDYFRLSASDCKAAMALLLESERLQQWQVESWQQPAYTLPDVSWPRTQTGSTLLTPFDPLVWNRDRARRLFGFDYRIEIYVPAHKREYGYYVMPFLDRNRISARVDLQAQRHRGQSTLNVLGIWYEKHADGDTAVRLRQALASLAEWLELERVSYADNTTTMAPA